MPTVDLNREGFDGDLVKLSETVARHTRAPGVAAADYVSTSLQYPRHILLQNFSFTLSQLNRS